MREVTIGCDDLKIKIHAWQTGPAQLISHHHEGWQQIQRLMRMSFPEWQGAPGWEIGIPIIFDGFRRRRSVEREISKLERMAVPNTRYDPQRPPQVWFNAGGDIPHDRARDPKKRWIIAGSGLEWGTYSTHKILHSGLSAQSIQGVNDQILGSNDPSSRFDPHANLPHPHFHRIRQELTVHLWEFFTERIDIASLHNLHYKIKKHDTLRSISLRFYGDTGHWRKIAKANKLRDPHHLKVGKVIKLP